MKKKTKYQLLPKVVISTIASNVKITKVDKTPNTTLYTTPITPPNIPSKPVICNILSKRPLSDTEKANMKRIWKDIVTFNFHDEIDNSQLLTAELPQHEHCCEQILCKIIFLISTYVITYDSCTL